MKPHSSLSEGKVRLIMDSIEGWQEQAVRHERMAVHEAELGNLGSIVVQGRKARVSRAVALALLFELFDGRHRCACCCLPDPEPGHKRDDQFDRRAQQLWDALLEQANQEVEGEAEIIRHNKIFTPWTEEQVAGLNRMQTSSALHPFTGEPGPNGEETVLIATQDGWIEREGGPVVQTWAWRWMAEVL